MTREKETMRVIHIPPGVSRVEMWKPLPTSLNLMALSYTHAFLPSRREKSPAVTGSLVVLIKRQTGYFRILYP
jgi:hypothetical protein